MTHLQSKQKAFTLAEVLITLAIIGVVAAMTIPTLLTQYQEKQTISKLLKVYSTLSNAYQMMIAEHGTIDTWGLNDTKNEDPDTGEITYDWEAQQKIAERLKPYLRISKTCELNKICLNKKSYALSGTYLDDIMIPLSTNDSPPESRFFLNDGTFVSFGWVTNGTVDFYVVLDGKDSILGKNRFYFRATQNGIKPEGTADAVSNKFEMCDPTNTSFSNAGRGCTAWVIYNKNMDYLHCREKLGWDKARSCKD